MVFPTVLGKQGAEQTSFMVNDDNVCASVNDLCACLNESGCYAN